MRRQAEVAELADAPDSKSGGLRAVWVRLPPSASRKRGAWSARLANLAITLKSEDGVEAGRKAAALKRSKPLGLRAVAKSVGILTGGGDCPGLNAVIRAVVRRADAAGWDVVAVREGWRGLVEPIFEDLGPSQVSGILPRGGTIIGTSRTNPFKIEGGVERVLQNFRDRELDTLVAIGGEDTLGVAARLYTEHQLPVVGVPKTIDNDLSGTDYTFSFDTAVSIATEAIDRL